MDVDDSIFGIDARFAAACDDAGGVLTEVGFFNAIGENPDVSVVGDFSWSRVLRKAGALPPVIVLPDATIPLPSQDSLPELTGPLETSER